MPDKESINKDHALRKIFRSSLEYGAMHNSVKITAVNYLEEHILCAFVRTENLYKIRDENNKPIDNIADMLPEGDILFKASSFHREFQVNKHIGDFTLFMLGMFPNVLMRKRGKEFMLGRIVIPGGNLFDLYMLQGRQSYKLASKLGEGEIFSELAVNFRSYMNVLELARIYLESLKNKQWLKAKNIIRGGN